MKVEITDSSGNKFTTEPQNNNSYYQTVAPGPVTAKIIGFAPKAWVSIGTGENPRIWKGYESDSDGVVVLNDVREFCFFVEPRGNSQPVKYYVSNTTQSTTVAAPDPVYANVKSPDIITISWPLVPGAKGYHVQMVTTGDQFVIVQTLSSSDKYVELKGFKPGTYNVRIAAFIDPANPSPSKTKTVKVPEVVTPKPEPQPPLVGLDGFDRVYGWRAGLKMPEYPIATLADFSKSAGFKGGRIYLGVDKSDVAKDKATRVSEFVKSGEWLTVTFSPPNDTGNPNAGWAQISPVVLAQRIARSGVGKDTLITLINEVLWFADGDVKRPYYPFKKNASGEVDLFLTWQAAFDYAWDTAVELRKQGFTNIAGPSLTTAGGPKKAGISDLFLRECLGYAKVKTEQYRKQVGDPNAMVLNWWAQHFYTNNPSQAEQILKTITEVLVPIGFKIVLDEWGLQKPSIVDFEKMCSVVLKYAHRSHYWTGEQRDGYVETTLWDKAGKETVYMDSLRKILGRPKIV